jgi:hypothetical protein
VIENSNTPYSFIAKGNEGQVITVFNNEKWEQIKNNANENNFSKRERTYRSNKKKLDLTFKRLLKSKRQTDCYFCIL